MASTRQANGSQTLAHPCIGSNVTLGALLRFNALPALLFAIANFGPHDSSATRSAFARALRAVGVALADVVGPPLYGIPSEERSAIHKEAKDALASLFTVGVGFSGTAQG